MTCSPWTTCRGDVGPARPGTTRTQTIYFFDPAGNRNEVFSDGYLTYPDFTCPDFPTITWADDKLARDIFYIGQEMKQTFTSVVTRGPLSLDIGPGG